MNDKKYYWETKELVTIGTFAALIKISSFLVSIAGGGMNPITMMIKNILATAFLIVLVFTVRKFGVITLYVLVSGFFSMLSLGSGVMLLPGTLLAGIIADITLKAVRGYRSNLLLILGVALYDFLFRAISLGFGFLFMRENPKLLYLAMFAIGIGYIGCFIGIYFGIIFSRELRHAGLIKE